MSEVPTAHHLGTLSLFMDADGECWLTVVDCTGAIRVGAETGQRPMAVLAEWLEEGAERFVSAWGSIEARGESSGAD